MVCLGLDVQVGKKGYDLPSFLSGLQTISVIEDGPSLNNPPTFTVLTSPQSLEYFSHRNLANNKVWVGLILIPRQVI